MLPILFEFCLEGNVIACKRHGFEHINESYLLQIRYRHARTGRL